MNVRALLGSLRRARRLAVAALALLLAAAAMQAAGATSESAVKAAFLYKFGSFVEWPPDTFQSPAQPLVIGVYGDESVASELEQLTRGRMLEGRPVRVLRVRDLDATRPVHILFAGGPREARARELIASVRGPVLTVGEGPIGDRTGAVLSFTQSEGRVRFSASLAAAAARNLKLSAKLLAVARQVEGR